MTTGRKPPSYRIAMQWCLRSKLMDIASNVVGLYLFQGVIKVTLFDNLFVEHRNMFFFLLILHI